MRALERRAVAAATATAAASGLASNDPVVIHAQSNVLLHLRPAPVVARVMTGTVALHDAPRRWLERELSVLAFPAPTGLAVPPTGLIDPRPHCRNGLWMTLPSGSPRSSRHLSAGRRCPSPTHARSARC